LLEAGVPGLAAKPRVGSVGSLLTDELHGLIEAIFEVVGWHDLTSRFEAIVDAAKEQVNGRLVSVQFRRAPSAPLSESAKASGR
jgi:hypothetical protein